MGRHGRNVSWLLTAEVFGKAISVFYFAYLSRKITVVENGWYGTYLTILPIIMVLNTMGFHDVVIREVAKNRERVHGLVSSSLVFQTLLLLAVVPAAWLAAGLLDYHEDLRKIVFLSAVSGYLWALINMHLAIISAYERFKYSSIIEMIVRSATIGGAIAILYLDRGLLALVLYLSCMHALHLVLCAAVARSKCVAYRFEPNLRDVRYLLRHGIPLVVGRFASTAYYYGDVPLLNSLSNPQAVGFYSVGMRFMILLQSFPNILENIIYPLLSRKSGEDEGGQQYVLERFIKLVFLLGLPMAVGMTILSKDIVVLLLGDKFAQGATATAVLTWVLAFAMVERMAANYLRAKTRQELPMYCYTGTFVLKLVLCFVVVPSYGSAGLLAVNLGVTALMVAVMLVMARRVLGSAAFLPSLLRLAVRPAAASVVMGAAVWFVREQSVLVSIPIGMAVYGIALLVTGAIDAFDREMIRSTLGRGKA